MGSGQTNMVAMGKPCLSLCIVDLLTTTGALLKDYSLGGEGAHETPENIHQISVRPPRQKECDR